MVRFAPRYGIVSPCLARPIRVRHVQAVNDNAQDWCETFLEENETLDTALRMFAAHGFSAASRACDAAEIADKGGDDERSQFWLEVCRTLDRRLARDFAQRMSR